MKTENSKKNKNSVNQIYLRAIEMVTGTSKLTEKQSKALVFYVKETMRRLHCCVLWNRDEQFLELLSSVGISRDSIGRREVIINERYELLYSRDYKKFIPKAV